MRFDPLVPWPVIGVAAALAAGFIVLRAMGGAPAGAIVRSTLLVVLALVAVADPAVTGASSEARTTAADVLFVVDTTASTAAVDYGDDATRLSGMQADIAELAAEFPGARFSLIRFDSVARVEVPWTTDADALVAAAAVLRPERAVYSRGSLLDRPLAVIDEQLASSRAVAGDDGYGVVFFLSDGEQKAPDPTAANTSTVSEQTADFLAGVDAGRPPIESFDQIAPLVSGGAVLGYGTETGAAMLEFVGRDGVTDVDEDPYVQDYATGEPAISRIDEASLQSVADDIGIAYVHREEPGGLAGLASSIADSAPATNAGERTTLRRLYWIPAIGLVAVAVWQAVATSAEALSARRLFGGASRKRRPA